MGVVTQRIERSVPDCELLKNPCVGRILLSLLIGGHKRVSDVVAEWYAAKVDRYRNNARHSAVCKQLVAIRLLKVEKEAKRRFYSLNYDRFVNEWAKFFYIAYNNLRTKRHTRLNDAGKVAFKKMFQSDAFKFCIKRRIGYKSADKNVFTYVGFFLGNPHLQTEGYTLTLEDKAAIEAARKAFDETDRLLREGLLLYWSKL